jgi:protein TonB
MRAADAERAHSCLTYPCAALHFASATALPHRHDIMKTLFAFSIVAASFLAGCASSPSVSLSADQTGRIEKVETRPDGTSTAATLEAYKADIAQRITQSNSTKVYTERPQALLRSVIVVRYAIDGNGHLMRSEVVRTNRDHATEATALATLRSAAPFPKPSAHLLRNGRVEMSESWLFNNDGRFQLRSVALPQLPE